MINQEKVVYPAIGFDFGVSQATVSIEQHVTVWLDSQYNQEAYNFDLVSMGAYTVEKKSNYEYSISFASTGVYEIYIEVTPAGGGKGKNLESNKLTITVE